MKQIHTDNAPAAIGPYSQGYISNGFFFTSGQIALNPKTGEVVGADIEGQTEQIMKNLSERMRESLVDEIEIAGAVRMSQVQEARGVVVAGIRRFEESGQIVIRRDGEDDYVQ